MITSNCISISSWACRVNEGVSMTFQFFTSFVVCLMAPQNTQRPSPMCFRASNRMFPSGVLKASQTEYFRWRFGAVYRPRDSRRSTP